MNEYLCEWRIDITADTPEDAAKQAEQLMREAWESTWHVTDADGEVTEVDI
jgi:hypothetical protein